jgi:hypothetical protein
MTGGADQPDRMKVFVSYSRADVAFADQLVIALESHGFDPILDRRDIDAAENWKARLGGLILSCDAVAFVLTEKSAGSPICAWEVEEANKLGKRIVPVVPAEATGNAPQALVDLNWIHFYATPAIPGSGMFDGLAKLVRALRVDLPWLREQTRLSERATEWASGQAEDRLLRGAALKEAQDWLGHAPMGAGVPASVREYLARSADAEQARETAARAQLEEREQALKAAEQAIRANEAAQAARASATSRLRRVSTVSLIAGAILVGLASIGGWLAANNYAAASARRSILMAREANVYFEDADYARAMLAALYGDPAATNGPLERWFFPNGFGNARTSLARAYANNLLAKATRPDAEGRVPEISPSGRFVLVRGRGREVAIRRLETGKVVSRFVADEHAAWAAFAPDESIVATSSHTAITLWRVDNGSRVADLPISLEEFSAVPVALSNNGLVASTGQKSETAQIWKLADKRPYRKVVGGSLALNSVAFSSNAKLLATGSEGGAVKVWDVATGRMIASFVGHSYSVTSIAFSPDNAMLLTGSNDHTVRLWDIKTGKLLCTFMGHQDWVLSVAFSHQGSMAVTGDRAGVAMLWRIPDRDQAVRDTLEGLSKDGAPADWEFLAKLARHPSHILSVRFSHDDKEVLTASYDGTVMRWRVPVDYLSTRSQSRRNDAISSIDASRHQIDPNPDEKGWVWGQISETERSLVFQTAQGVRWIAPQGEEVMFYRDADGVDRASFAFSRDETMIATEFRGVIKLWSTYGGPPLQTVGVYDSFGRLGFSSDDANILSEAWDGDRLLIRRTTIDPIFRMSAREQVTKVCSTLGEMGNFSFSEADLQQLEIPFDTPHPCAALWSTEDRAAEPS